MIRLEEDKGVTQGKGGLMMGGCGGVNLEDERVMENEWSREGVSMVWFVCMVDW